MILVLHSLGSEQISGVIAQASLLSTLSAQCMYRSNVAKVSRLR